MMNLSVTSPQRIISRHTGKWEGGATAKDHSRKTERHASSICPFSYSGA